MKTTISYEGLDPIEKHNKAIQDIKEYLGAQKFEEVVGLFKGREMPLENFQCYMGLGGIEGYPVKAFYNHIYGL